MKGKYKMNKTELISAMSEKSELTKVDTEKSLKAFIDTGTEELKNKGKVQITGFGSFEVSHRNAREGRNPQTGETMMLKESYSPKFKAGKGLKDAVNS